MSGSDPMTPHVFIVDDSLTVRADLADAFEQAGFSVAPLADGAAALAAIDERAPDLPSWTWCCRTWMGSS